jgi:hypothetical protein
MLNLISAVTLGLRLGSYTTFFFVYLQIWFGTLPLAGRVSQILDCTQYESFPFHFWIGAIFVFLFMAMTGCKRQIGYDAIILSHWFEKTKMYDAVRPEFWEFGWRFPIPQTGSSLGDLDQMTTLVTVTVVTLWAALKHFAKDVKEHFKSRMRAGLDLEMSRIFPTP